MRICDIKKRGFDKDVLLLLEHAPVITFGRSADKNNLLVDERLLKNKGVELFPTDRGGDITFHGPGQLVGYPILALRQEERDVRNYMRRLEESLIRLLDTFDITGTRSEGFTGVWIDDGKIAAMGVHLSRWITRHGFALNVHTDLSFFNMIIPCGLAGKSVTSMYKLKGQLFPLQIVADRFTTEFGTVFGRRMIRTDTSTLIGELDRFGDNVDSGGGKFNDY